MGRESTIGRRLSESATPRVQHAGRDVVGDGAARRRSGRPASVARPAVGYAVRRARAWRRREERCTRRVPHATSPHAMRRRFVDGARGARSQHPWQLCPPLAGLGALPENIACARSGVRPPRCGWVLPWNFLFLGCKFSTESPVDTQGRRSLFSPSRLLSSVSPFRPT
jgi:hypothetical protein